MNKYTFRVDVIQEVQNIEERIQQALEGFPKYLISYEKATITGKLHYQGIIFTEWKHEKYKKYMEKMFDEWKSTKGKGAGKRSFAIVKKDEYEIYITKDGDFRFVKGYTDEEIKELQDQSYQKTTQSNPQEKNKEKSWFFTLIDFCQQQGVTYHSSGWEIASAIIEAYEHYVKCEPNDFQIKCYAKSIQRTLIKRNADLQGTEKAKAAWETYKRKRAEQIIGYEWVHQSLI